MKKILSIALTIFTFALKAQEVEPINTDRPDQSDGIYIVKPRVFQLETGPFFNRLDAYNQSLVQSSMLRYGLVKRVELRLVFEFGSFNNQYFHTSEAGVFPLAFCSKIALIKEKGIIPAITFSGYVRLPFTASKNFKPPYYLTTGILVFQHSLSEKFTLSYNAGVTRSGDDKSTSFPVTTVLSFAATNRLSIFGEYYAYYQQKTLPSNNFDGGFLFLIKPQMQLDVAFATTLMPHVKSNYVTVGFSYRFNELKKRIIEDYEIP